MTASLKIKSQRVFLNTKSAKRPAAILLVQTHDGQFLALKRSAGMEYGHWGFLGGMVDIGETPLDAVKREAYEEGRFISKKKIEYLDVFTAKSDKYGETPVHIFRTTIDHPCQIQINREHSAVGWFKLKDLPSPQTTLMQFLNKKFGRNLNHATPRPLHP